MEIVILLQSSSGQNFQWEMEKVLRNNSVTFEIILNNFVNSIGMKKYKIYVSRVDTSYKGFSEEYWNWTVYQNWSLTMA